MVIIKVKKCTGGYKTDYLYNALDYLYDKEKALHIGGYGVDPTNLEKTYKQMVYVKKYFESSLKMLGNLDCPPAIIEL